MKDEVYNATNLSTHVAVSAVAKAALLGPQTKENLVNAKADLTSLVTTGKVVFKDNAHLLIGTPNHIQQVFADGLARPIALYDFDSLNLQAKKVS